MWAVIRASLPGALSKCNTTYPMIQNKFAVDDFGCRVFDRSMCGRRPEWLQGVSKGSPFGLLGLF